LKKSSIPALHREASTSAPFILKEKERKEKGFFAEELTGAVPNVLCRPFLVIKQERFNLFAKKGKTAGEGRGTVGAVGATGNFRAFCRFI